MTPAERRTKFIAIERAFKLLDMQRLQKGEYATKDTAYGIWGASNMKDAYDLFTKIRLEKNERFADLGCGDGRIVLIASLFTSAVGIEGEQELVDMGLKIRDELSLPNAELRRGDYCDEDLSRYDVLFMFPDKAFDEKMVGKLKNEFTGTLYVYNKMRTIPGITPGKTLWLGQLPIGTYQFSSDLLLRRP